MAEPPNPYTINTGSNQYPGLVSLWPTQPTIVTTVDDPISGNTGTLNIGNGWVGSDPIVGGAITFDGTTNAFVQTANTSLGISTYPIQLRVWFKTTSTADMRVFGLYRVTQADIMDIRMNLGAVGAFIRNHSGNSWGEDSAGTYNDGNWHMAILTSYASNSHALMIDGTTVLTNATDIPDPLFNEVDIGYRNFFGAREAPFDGSIAHPGYYTGTVMNATVQGEAYDEDTRWDLYSPVGGAVPAILAGRKRIYGARG